MSVNRNVRGVFGKDILSDLGVGYIPLINRAATYRRLAGLFAWMRAESGDGLNDGVKGPQDNPLCTTWPYSFSAYNSVGVRNFPDFATGVKWSYKTMLLTGHNYEPIVKAIKAADTLAIVKAVDASDWGTKGAEASLSYVLANITQEYNRPVGVSSLA